MNRLQQKVSRTLRIERLEQRFCLASSALSYVGVTAFNAAQPYPGVDLTVDGSHGPNGNRWSIAIIDTGIDLDHPFFVRDGLVNGVAEGGDFTFPSPSLSATPTTTASSISPT